MTRQASRFTPEVMLSAPRRSPGAPNSTGELILYTVSWHPYQLTIEGVTYTDRSRRIHSRHIPYRHRSVYSISRMTLLMSSPTTRMIPLLSGSGRKKLVSSGHKIMAYHRYTIQTFRGNSSENMPGTNDSGSIGC